MTQLLESDFTRVHDDYSTGRALGWKEPPSYEGMLEREVKESFRRRLPECDRKVVKAARRLGHSGVVAAREGRLEDAELSFRAALKVEETYPLFLESKMVCQAAFHNGYAYVDYRRGDFDEAVRRVSLTLELEDALENRFGYAHYHIHRLHVLENLVRVYWGAGRAEDAVDLTASLLTYMNGASDNPGGAGDWDRGNMSLFGEDLARDKFLNIFDNLALNLHNMDAGRSTRLLSRFIERCSAPKTGWLHPVCEEWLKVRELFHRPRMRLERVELRCRRVGCQTHGTIV